MRMPFGMMLAARLARGAFSGLEGSSSFEGILSPQKSGMSFDAVRSSIFSDQPASSLDVSKSGFNTNKGLLGQDTVLPKGDSDSLFSSKSPSDHSGETGTITSRTADGPKKATDETDNHTSTKTSDKDVSSKTSDKIKSKESKNSTWKRLMKGVSAYYNPTNFDGRVLAMRGVDSGLGQQSNSIDAATTRVIRGDSSTSMNDFTDRPVNNQQNSIVNDMLIMHLFAKSQQKAQEAEKREMAKTDEFNEEFTRRINEEAARLKEHAGANTSSIRQSENSRDAGKQDHTRDAGKQDHIRGRSASR